MFRELTLSYFRQHEALTVNFEPGVVALRGRNEKGKTTLLEAMAYAMFGTRALRESLDDVVTWGQKVSKLRVSLMFTLNLVDYIVTRGKSGAEIRLRDGDRILATGQDEVSSYIEKLLGADRETCTKLMLANQDDIKGTLSKPGAALELIEKLSNLCVIDTIIGLVQSALPSGRTTSIEARIATLEEQVAQPVADETAPLQEGHNFLALIQTKKQHRYDDAKKDYDAFQVSARTAQEVITAHEQAVQQEATAQKLLEGAEVALSKVVVPALPTNIPELRKRVEDANYMGRVAAAAEAMGKVEEPENVWEGDYDSLLAEVEATRSKINAANNVINDAKTGIARLEAQRITQTACGLCGKDLSAVPEVLTKNAEIEQRIAAKEAVLEEHQTAHQIDTTTLGALLDIQKTHNVFMALYQRHAEFVTLAHTHCPPKWEWSGPEEIVEDDNALTNLRTAEQAEREHHAGQGRRAQLEADVVRLRAQLEAATATAAKAAGPVKAAQTALENAATLLSALNAAQEDLRIAREATQAASQALAVAQAGLRERQAARALLGKQLSDARAEMAETADNNALIQFLREARIEVTDQLWSMVMTTVSSYFSSIRGVPSVVSRSDNGFRVDGRPVAGLSGSTKDALGLAIRKACTKTFLPNCPFLMLDEPAAACDDEREANMLGLIASGGFEQVILITHSDLADSFANQVVQL